MRQIGPLHIRTLGELRKLPVIDMHRRRNIQGKPRLLLARLDFRTRVVGGQRVGAAEVEGFPTAAGGAVEVYFLRGYGTVGSDHACCHAAFGVPENVALWDIRVLVVWNGLTAKDGLWARRLTLTVLMKPRTMTTIPEDITIRQNARPSDSSLVASLFKFPRMETPRMIMATPSVTKPELGLSRGQLRTK